MRVALATEGSIVAQHFGRCEMYTLVDIEEGKEVKRDTVNCPEHQPGLLPAYLSKFNITHIIAGGMGPKAQDLFAENNIEVILGVSGSLEEVIERFIKGNLTGGDSLCDHGPDHVCDHD